MLNKNVEDMKFINSPSVPTLKRAAALASVVIRFLEADLTRARVAVAVSYRGRSPKYAWASFSALANTQNCHREMVWGTRASSGRDTGMGQIDRLVTGAFSHSRQSK